MHTVWHEIASITNLESFQKHTWSRLTGIAIDTRPLMSRAYLVDGPAELVGLRVSGGADLLSVADPSVPALTRLLAPGEARSDHSVRYASPKKAPTASATPVDWT